GTPACRSAGVAFHAGAVAYQGEVSARPAAVAFKAFQPRLRRPRRARVAGADRTRFAQRRFQARNLGADGVERGFHPGADFGQVQFTPRTAVVAGGEHFLVEVLVFGEHLARGTTLDQGDL